MPRLTNSTYLRQRQLLFDECHDHGGGVFGDLPSQHQMDLHDFYAVSEPMTDREALRHRTAMT